MSWRNLELKIYKKQMFPSVRSGSDRGDVAATYGGDVAATYGEDGAATYGEDVAWFSVTSIERYEEIKS